jgi:hypothetical protein
MRRRPPHSLARSVPHLTESARSPSTTLARLGFLSPLVSSAREDGDFFVHAR